MKTLKTILCLLMMSSVSFAGENNNNFYIGLGVPAPDYIGLGDPAVDAITVSNAEVTKQQFAPFGQDSNLICDPETGECYTPEAWAAKNAKPVSNAFTPSENWTTYVGSNSSGSTGSAVSYGSVGSRTVFYSGSVGSQQSYGSNGGGAFSRPGIVPRVTTRMVRVRVPCATCPSGFRWEMQPQTVNVYPVGSRSNYAQRWSVQGGNANLSNHMADHAAAGHHVAAGQSLEEQHDAIHDQVGPGYMVGNQFVSTGGGYGNQSAILQTRQVMTFRGPVSYVRGQPVRNMAARLFPRIAARRGW